ncbi:hypothetical protein [uncultured Arthrobacter sp.]|uniref:hypothetical protein n=1 Tax=uncultured Arthrobacter sp. TaxID=114050 RepID=UPI00260B464F|nr:hypothetical protein [uncultured Arthrobacter sp.]
MPSTARPAPSVVDAAVHPAAVGRAGRQPAVDDATVHPADAWPTGDHLPGEQPAGQQPAVARTDLRWG